MEKKLINVLAIIAGKAEHRATVLFSNYPLATAYRLSTY